MQVDFDTLHLRVTYWPKRRNLQAIALPSAHDPVTEVHELKGGPRNRYRLAENLVINVDD
jgi:hypothetical protein